MRKFNYAAAVKVEEDYLRRIRREPTDQSVTHTHNIPGKSHDSPCDKENTRDIRGYNVTRSEYTLQSMHGQNFGS